MFISLIFLSTSVALNIFQTHLVFRNISILDCTHWLTDGTKPSSYGKIKIVEVTGHRSQLFAKKDYDFD